MPTTGQRLACASRRKASRFNIQDCSSRTLCREPVITQASQSRKNVGKLAFRQPIMPKDGIVAIGDQVGRHFQPSGTAFPWQAWGPDAAFQIPIRIRWTPGSGGIFHIGDPTAQFQQFLRLAGTECAHGAAPDSAAKRFPIEMPRWRHPKVKGRGDAPLLVPRNHRRTTSGGGLLPGSPIHASTPVREWRQPPDRDWRPPRRDDVRTGAPCCAVRECKTRVVRFS